jgi:hypothetical protein
MAGIAGDYYAALRTRKLGITRPSQIPVQQLQCVDACCAEWQEVADLPDVAAVALLGFRA